MSGFDAGGGAAGGLGAADARDVGAGWAELVATAVQGTARRSAAVEVFDGVLEHGEYLHAMEPTERLLGLAALTTAGRRAGAAALTGASPATPALPETRPVAPGLARWFDGLLVGHRELLGELLEGMGERGLLLPPTRLPDLLDLAAAEVGLADAALAVGGERGRWLAGQDPRWAGVVARLEAPGMSGGAAEGTVAGARDTPGTPGKVPREAVTPGERDTPGTPGKVPREAVSPGEWEAAREALTHGREPADVRERLVWTIARYPFDGVDELLDQSLDDRAVGVRRTAARALGARMASAYQQRMAQRATSWVAVQRRGGFLGRGRTEIVVTLPESLDEAARRDLVDKEAHLLGPAIKGEKAQWLHAVVAATPLAAWAAAGEPAELIRAEVDAGWGPVLLQAWTARAVAEARHRSPLAGAWAAALLDDGMTTAGSERLLIAIDPLARVRAVIDRLSHPGDPSIGPRFAGAVPHPWPVDVLDAVLHTIVRGGDAHAWGWGEVIGGIGRREPTEHLARLDAAAHASMGTRATLLQRAADTMRLRAGLAAALDEAAAQAFSRGIPNREAPPHPPEGDTP